MAEGSVWADPEKSQQAVQQIKELKRWIDPYHAVRKRIDDARALLELSAGESDEEHARLVAEMLKGRSLEQEADAIAERVTRMEQPAPASAPALDHAHLMGPVSSDRAGAVRRTLKNVQPEDVSAEMAGQTFRLRKAFSDGMVSVPAGEVITVTSWDNDRRSICCSVESLSRFPCAINTTLENEFISDGVAPTG